MNGDRVSKNHMSFFYRMSLKDLAKYEKYGTLSIYIEQKGVKKFPTALRGLGGGGANVVLCPRCIFIKVRPRMAWLPFQKSEILSTPQSWY